MGEVAIESLAALVDHIRFLFALSSRKIRLLFACTAGQRAPRELAFRIAHRYGLAAAMME